MKTGLDPGLRKIDDSTKTAFIKNELNRLNIDNGALTGLLDTGHTSEANYTFFTLVNQKSKKGYIGWVLQFKIIF